MKRGRWSKDEIEDLQTMCEKKYSDEKIAEKLNRSIATIQSQIEKNNFHNMKDVPITEAVSQSDMKSQVDIQSKKKPAPKPGPPHSKKPSSPNFGVDYDTTKACSLGEVIGDLNRRDMTGDLVCTYEFPPIPGKNVEKPKYHTTIRDGVGLTRMYLCSKHAEVCEKEKRGPIHLLKCDNDKCRGCK